MSAYRECVNSSARITREWAKRIAILLRKDTHIRWHSGHECDFQVTDGRRCFIFS